MKSIILVLVGMIWLQGCGIAVSSVAGIPATEYAINSKSTARVGVPVTMGLVAAHGGITYLLWAACWPCGVAYLGFSGIYTMVRVAEYQDGL